MKNQTVHISVSEDERYLNIDGDLALLNKFMAAFRGERVEAPNDATEQPIRAEQRGGHDERS